MFSFVFLIFLRWSVVWEIYDWNAMRAAQDIRNRMECRWWWWWRQWWWDFLLLFHRSQCDAHAHDAHLSPTNVAIRICTGECDWNLREINEQTNSRDSIISPLAISHCKTSWFNILCMNARPFVGMHRHHQFSQIKWNVVEWMRQNEWNFYR